MKFLTSIIVLIITLLGLTLAGQASAVTLLEQATFSGAQEAVTFRLHLRPHVMLTEADNTVSVYKGSKLGSSWGQLDSSRNSVRRLPNTASSFIDPVEYKRWMYIGINTDNGPKMVRIPTNNRPANWKRTGNTVMTAAGNEISITFPQYANPEKNNKIGALFAVVQGDNGATLFKKKNNKRWKSIGEAGLGNGINAVTGVSRMRTDDGQYVLISTDDGQVYRSSILDMNNWELLYDTGYEEITDMEKYRGKLYLTVKNNAGIDVLISEDGYTYDQLDDLGEFDDATDATLGSFGKSSLYEMHVFTEDAASGSGIAQIRWPLKEDTFLKTEFEHGIEDQFYSPLRMIERFLLGRSSEGVTIYKYKP